MINPAISTMFLFAIVAFWSRLPGVGTPPPGEWLALFDLVDMFSLIISINLGGLTGGLFSLFANLGSRLAGSFPDWIQIIKDAVAQFVVCLIIPYVHIIAGRNILTSMALYTLLRMVVMLLLRFVYAQNPLPQALFMMTIGTILLLMINSFYTALFGNFFDNLLKAGVRFSWVLFIFVTLVIFGSKVYFGYIKTGKLKHKN